MNQDKTKWMRFNKEVMPGGCGVTGSGCSGDELLTVTVVRDEHGYGMKVSGDNPVYVQSVKEHGAAWRAGLRAGDRILRVDGAPVHDQAHQTVVHMIRANPTAVLTVQPNAHRHITAPLPVNQEKQRQVEFTKVKTVQLMLDNERKYIWDLKNELLKVPDVRKQAQLELAEQRCTKLQQEIENMKASQSCQDVSCEAPRTPRADTASPPASTPASFLSGLPRSLSNLTGQSLRNLRHARHAATRTQQSQQQPLPSVPPLVRQKSDEGKRRHNNTVPLVPTTCLDNAPPPPPPPPLPPRRDQHPPPPPLPTSRRSHEPERDELQPNSIAMQMSYPLVNVSPPPLQTDNRTSMPVLHARSHSSPEQLDTAQPAYTAHLCEEKDVTPPPGTPPPPYAHNTQPCADPQRAIISMEEDDSTASETSTSLGLFSNLKEVKESRARMAVLLNWLLGERRCACSCLFLLITDGYRTATGVANATLRRWAYEIQSTFLMPNAVLAITSVDENIANEIEQVLANDYDKDEILRNVFRKARQKAKDELSQHLTEFQRKRQVGLGTLYGPEDSVLLRCDADKAQELVVVERLVCGSIRAVAGGAARGCSNGAPGPDAHAALLAALVAAAHCLQARPHTIAAAASGGRASFLLRDKHYKQRLKQLAKQPMIVRGHHLSLQAMTAASDCHHCDNVIWGLAPQAYVCTDCKLRVHRSCARIVEEPCCIDGNDQPKRISRFMERIQHNANANNAGQDTNEKKSRKSSATSHFLNMERSVRKNEDEQPWEQTVATNNVQGESRREGSSEEPAGDADADASDTKDPDKDSSSWRHLSAGGGRGVNRAESCRERGGSAAHVRRGKQRNASDPNRLTADQAHNDLEANAGVAGGAAPSGSSSSSSLSSRSNESNTAAPNHQAWQSEWSEEEEPLAAAWADTVPAHVLDALDLSPRHRKRQEVIHELIVSEGSHVRWLRVLGCVFLRPLERGEHAHLLTPDELRALFPNLPQVLERHMRLYTSLKQLRVGPSAEHAVRLRPLADVVLQTLGEPGYAVCVSRFCRGQRMALEALRERRRKNKELHQFLAAREQDPLCGRLQLRDLIACVWQRLTKYQLLLENILRTVVDEDEDSEEDVARLRLSLDTAKEVLHSVDTAIRTAENDHRLRTIQNKLEVRVGSSGGGEFEELRRFELTRHILRMEGDLMIRTDTNKRVPVLALMLEDCLVLLHREGDRFLLKPIPQPSQSGLLSPIVRWSTVLFRPNAAVRNAFFLMNLNGVQMHELSANTPAEYSMWCKYIQEAPLADARTGPHHAPVRAPDDNSSTGVTRNPSDASERSGSAPNEGADAPPAERPESAAADTPPPAPATPAPPAAPATPAPPTPDTEKKQIPRRPTVGRISTHGPELTAPLEPSAALTVHPPAAHARAHTASRALTPQERLRRLDAAVGRALRAKSQLVGELLAVPRDERTASAVAELAVADALGQLDVNREMRLTAVEGFEEAEGVDHENDAPDVHQLLLAAQAQANYLTMALTRALSVSEADVVAARGSARGVCDSCARRRTLRRSSTLNAEEAAASPLPPATASPVPSQTSTTLTEAVNTLVEVPSQTPQVGVELNDSMLSTVSPAGAWTVLHAEDDHDPGAELSYDTLPELGHDDMALSYDDGDDTTAEPLLGCGSLGDIGTGGGGAAVLASRLVGAACGLQATLGRLLAALPALDAHARAARAHLAHERDANDALRARLLHERGSRDPSEPPDADGALQERPSSGG